MAGYDATLVIEDDDGTRRALRKTDLQTIDEGVFGYAAGTIAGTIDVPALANIKRVRVTAGDAAATLVIAAGATITVPAGATFDEPIVGSVSGDVVLSGDIEAYYVSWVL